MCRNIKPLFNFEPATTAAEIESSALQFVRKVSGMTKPSETNREVFDRAVEEITEATTVLLNALVTKSPPRDRDEEKQKAIERGRKRDEQTRRRLLADAK